MLLRVTVIQPYRVVSTTGTATVQCYIQPQPAYHQAQSSDDQSPPYPYPDPEEFRVTLLRGPHGSILCSSMINFTEQRDTHVRKDGEVQCTTQVREGAVEVTVSGLKATDTDIYRCDIEMFYPPPYLRLTGNGTLIHVLDRCTEQGAERQVAPEDDEEEDESDTSFSVPVVVLVTLIIFVLVIIMYLQAVQCYRGRREVIRAVPVGAHKVEAVAVSYGNFA